MQPVLLGGHKDPAFTPVLGEGPGVTSPTLLLPSPLRYRAAARRIPMCHK